jgi:hypothetical protein
MRILANHVAEQRSSVRDRLFLSGPLRDMNRESYRRICNIEYSILDALASAVEVFCFFAR